MRPRFVKNAVANLSKGGTAAIVAMLLPPILVRHMDPASYAVWILVLQIVAYVGYLDFGLQTAIGRYVAYANEIEDPQRRDGIFSTASAGLGIAALLGIVLILIATVASPYFFRSVPANLVIPMRIAMLIIGISVAIGLPASAWNGVFVGLQRYEIPAITTGAGRLLSVIGLILVATHSKSLVWMAVVMAASNILSYVLQFGCLRRIASDVRFRAELISKPLAQELTGYCLSLTVWSFSMLLVTGFDVVLVGRFQFGAVTPYSISATLIAFLGGVQNAIFGVIMPYAAGLHARQNSKELGNLLIKTTRTGVLLLLTTGLPLIVFASPIIKLWIGSQFAQEGGRLLVILVLANMLRLTGTPYASILIGTGQQRLIIVSPLMEGFTNIISSIFLGVRYGAIGIAWGTLIGAVVGVLMNIFYNLPRTRTSIDVGKSRFAFSALTLPSLCGIPVCIAMLIANICTTRGNVFVLPALLASAVLCAFFLLRSSARGFHPSEPAMEHRP